MILPGAALLVLLAGCATHELVLSRTLSPLLSEVALGYPVEHARARVYMGRLEARLRSPRRDEDFSAVWADPPDFVPLEWPGADGR